MYIIKCCPCKIARITALTKNDSCNLNTSSRGINLNRNDSIGTVIKDCSGKYGTCEYLGICSRNDCAGLVKKTCAYPELDSED